MKSVKEKMKELEKEILGKEMELLDLDNMCMKIINTSSSLYDNIYDSINFKEFTYATGDFEGIIVIFEILDELNEESDDEIDIFKIKVKATEILEF